MVGSWYLVACPRPLKMPDGVTGSLRRQQLFIAGWQPQTVSEPSGQDVVWVGTTESMARSEKFANSMGESWKDWNEVCDLEQFATSDQPVLASFREAIQAFVEAEHRGKGHAVVRLSQQTRNQRSA